MASLAWLVGGFSQAIAADRLTMIRDAEIEATIRTYADPLLHVAGLDREAVQVHLVQDSRLNAFVAGGMNLFINTGLLQSSETPNEVIGVIAHEIGHISGGHLIRRQEALENATAEAILATVLGAVVTVASGGEAGAVIIQSGQAAAQGSLLRYSQGQESAADQAGLKYLEQTGQSARGLLKLFHKLEDQELLISARQSPYLRTHPLTRERVRAVEFKIEQSTSSDAKDPPERVDAHQRMVAKLVGFIEPADKILRLYPLKDHSIYARYARAVSYHRQTDLPRALAEVDSLIAELPADPYFHELKGQILFEQGKVTEAIAPYAESVRLAPDEPLLRYGYGRALIEAGEASGLEEAVKQLKIAVEREPTYAPYWHFYGVALGRTGKVPESALAFAERAVLNGQYAEARFHAEKASSGLKAGSPQWLRAQDILNQANNHKEDTDR